MLSRTFKVRPAPQSGRSQQRIVRPGDAQQPECDYNRAGEHLENYHDPLRQASHACNGASSMAQKKTPSSCRCTHWGSTGGIIGGEGCPDR
jgi:hypothetical protein